MIKRLQSMRDSADVMRKRKGIKSGIIGGMEWGFGNHLDPICLLRYVRALYGCDCTVTAQFS